jgi:DNA polymerase-3 subunit delta
MSEPTFYVFQGEDELALRERLADLRARLGDPTVADLNTSLFDGKTVSLGQIQNAAGSAPFLSDRRLVIVENLFKTPNGDTLLEGLLAYLPTLPDWARVIFVETPAKLPASHPLIRLASEDPRGLVVNFDPPDNLERWIMKRATLYQAKIEPQAAHELAERVHGDPRLADVELAKLATYVDGQHPIALGDVALLTPYTTEANIFHMVDALGHGDGRTAARLLHRLLDEGDDPLRIFGMIVRQYRLLILAREHLDTGLPEYQAADTLGLHSYVAQKAIEQSRAYRLDDLERVYRFLLATDLSVKTGEVDIALALDLLVSTLTGV